MGFATPAALVVALLLTASGGPVARASVLPSKAKQPAAYLCQVLPHVDRLTVTRRALGNQFKFTFPTVVTVARASAPRAVASAACALPDFSSGVFHCPAAFAVTYQLAFAIKGDTGFGGEPVDLYATGCPMIKGLGAARAPSPSFYRVLARALGLKSYSSSTFRGTFTKAG